MMDDVLEFPLERSPPMKILAHLWSGSLLGIIIVSALSLLGIFMLFNTGFNIFAMIFFIGFIVPVAAILYTRLVVKGRKLLRKTCLVRFDEGILQFLTGFPNTMDPSWRSVMITDENRDIIIYGSELSGYQLKLSGDDKPSVRIGLWFMPEDAKNAADKIQQWTKGKISWNIEETDHSEEKNTS